MKSLEYFYQYILAYMFLVSDLCVRYNLSHSHFVRQNIIVCTIYLSVFCTDMALAEIFGIDIPKSRYRLGYMLS
jgi:hypothetical protein